MAEQVWRDTLKLPVWHRLQDLPLVTAYVRAIHKVVNHHKDLMVRR